MKAKHTRRALKIMLMAADIIPDIEFKNIDTELAELERLSEIGKAIEYLLNDCKNTLAVSTIQQIDCTQGGAYIKDVLSIIDLYNSYKKEGGN